jgi:hypothetical protein
LEYGDDEYGDKFLHSVLDSRIIRKQHGIATNSLQALDAWRA